MLLGRLEEAMIYFCQHGHEVDTELPHVPGHIVMSNPEPLLMAKIPNGAGGNMAVCLICLRTYLAREGLLMEADE